MIQQGNTIQQKLCVDCKFLYRDDRNINLCHRPISTNISSVTGELVTIVADSIAEYERTDLSKCGPNAKFFSPKVEKSPLKSIIDFCKNAKSTFDSIVKTIIIAGLLLTLFIYFGYEIQQILDDKPSGIDNVPTVTEQFLRD